MQTDFSFGTAKGAFPVVGHMRQLLRQPLEFLEALSGVGDLVEIRLGTRRAYVACHPQLVRHMLTDSRLYDKEDTRLEAAQEKYGDSLATASRDRHRKLRRILQPAFDHTSLEKYSALLEQEIEALAGHWRRGQVLDVFPEFRDFATRAVSRTLFPDHIGEETLKEIQCLFRSMGGAGRQGAVSRLTGLLRGMGEAVSSDKFFRSSGPSWTV
ncbi:cytochrome P450 [Streptomyces stramineus]